MILSCRIFTQLATLQSFRPSSGFTIDIKSLQNRLLKVYVPATSTSFNRLLFFSFFAAAINSTNEANMAGSMRR
jgi:hypothetical protein